MSQEPSHNRLLVPTEHGGWLRDFEHEHGRPFRVLHIGNVANNAYLNAKILNRAGVASDVLCYSYYHIMGCPEWEDAPFDGKVDDPFLPDWSRVDLNGFQRPRWFAQGPMATAVAYLRARSEGHEELAASLWRQMQLRSTMAAWRPSLPYRIVRKLWRLSVKAGRRCLGRSAALTLTKRRAELCARFGDVFPDRPDQLIADDMRQFGDEMMTLGELFRHYDAIVAYATDGILPLFLNRPYFAFEHGTIRNIPFEHTSQGRLCALSYRLAEGVFITNCDNNVSAEKLGLENYRFVPHPINENVPDGADSALLRRHLREQLQADFLVFHPSRQHWDARRHPDWDKGNDVLIRGFARFVKDVCPHAGLVLVDWGQTVEASKALLEELGVTNRTLWIAPVPNQVMVRYIRACDVLADQFTLGVFGSTMPKALMLGVPAMLFLDQDKHRWCFDEMPPVLGGKNCDEVFEGLTSLYRRPELAHDLARRGQAWYRKYHGNDVILHRFLAMFAASPLPDVRSKRCA